MEEKIYTELLTIQEVAQLLRISQVTIRRRINEGNLTAVKVGGRIRVPRQAVDQLLKPIAPMVAKPARVKDRPITFDDPLWKLVGTATDAAPSDSSRKHEYLAES